MNPQHVKKARKQKASFGKWLSVHLISGCWSQSHCCHLDFRYHTCFEQGVSLQSRFTMKCVPEMIIIYSRNIYTQLFFVINLILLSFYFIYCDFISKFLPNILIFIISGLWILGFRIMNYKSFFYVLNQKQYYFNFFINHELELKHEVFKKLEAFTSINLAKLNSLKQLNQDKICTSFYFIIIISHYNLKLSTDAYFFYVIKSFYS